MPSVMQPPNNARDAVPDANDPRDDANSGKGMVPMRAHDDDSDVVRIGVRKSFFMQM